MVPNPMKQRTADAVLLLSVAGLVAVQFYVAYLSVTFALGLTLALAVLGLGALGVAINGRALGVVIDNRNRVSLSKLQMLIWTVLVLSAMAVVSSRLISIGWENPLQQFVPWELLAAMGISAATLVGSPVILSLKLDQASSASASTAAASEADGLRGAGALAVRDEPERARFSDIFKGDDTANATAPDLSKIQNFGITLLLVGSYVSALFAQLSRPGLFEATHLEKLTTAMAAWQAAQAAGGAPVGPPPVLFFPNLSHEFLWLMGISHGAYLAYKAAPHGKSGAETTSPSGGLPVAQADALG